MVKAKKKYKQGQYFLQTSKGFYLFNTRLMKGRAFLKGRKVFDFTFERYFKMCKSILKKGEWSPTYKHLK